MVSIPHLCSIELCILTEIDPISEQLAHYPIIIDRHYVDTPDSTGQPNDIYQTLSTLKSHLIRQNHEIETLQRENSAYEERHKPDLSVLRKREVKADNMRTA